MKTRVDNSLTLLCSDSVAMSFSSLISKQLRSSSDFKRHRRRRRHCCCNGIELGNCCWCCVCVVVSLEVMYGVRLNVWVGSFSCKTNAGSPKKNEIYFYIFYNDCLRTTALTVFWCMAFNSFRIFV